MTEHNIHAEPQPIADQWMLSCSCGWRKTQSLYHYIGPGAQLVASAARHQMIADHLLQAGRDAGGCGPIDVSKYVVGGDESYAYFEMTEALPNACTVFVNYQFGGESLEVARGEPELMEMRGTSDGCRYRYAVRLKPR